ncbi:MAG: hypothetical protein U0L42_05760 [Methanobrevibacter sp.]|uniref:hypothetical protein n=1 Tax=Methanobrevibacter sp. TaxID=66852 RepID=UPI002E77B552|nr:hypothetical protein [Methanobrevibacter sp.]MEE0935160.1 hypothetical protein [Methanobrevibacter sp.]
MKEIFIADDFSVDELTEKISNLMSKWSIKMLDINGPSWVIYDQDMEVKFLFFFEVDFNDIETRIKLEDLKLNVIHHIESLKDDTAYRDNLLNHPIL